MASMMIRDNDLSESGKYGIDAWESGGVRNSYLNNDVSNAGSFAIRQAEATPGAAFAAVSAGAIVVAPLIP